MQEHSNKFYFKMTNQAHEGCLEGLNILVLVAITPVTRCPQIALNEPGQRFD